VLDDNIIEIANSKAPLERIIELLYFKQNQYGYNVYFYDKCLYIRKSNNKWYKYDTYYYITNTILATALIFMKNMIVKYSRGPLIIDRLIDNFNQIKDYTEDKIEVNLYNRILVLSRQNAIHVIKKLEEHYPDLINRNSLLKVDKRNQKYTYDIEHMFKDFDIEISNIKSIKVLKDEDNITEPESDTEPRKNKKREKVVKIEENSSSESDICERLENITMSDSDSSSAPEYDVPVNIPSRKDPLKMTKDQIRTQELRRATEREDRKIIKKREKEEAKKKEEEETEEREQRALKNKENKRLLKEAQEKQKQFEKEMREIQAKKAKPKKKIVETSSDSE
jgi:hypothetical protein